jgi:hypothetical protein
MRARDAGGGGKETIEGLSFNSSIYTAVYFPFEVQKLVVQINQRDGWLFAKYKIRQNWFHSCVYGESNFWV